MGAFGPEPLWNPNDAPASHPAHHGCCAPIDAAEFVRKVTPPLERQDLPALVATLRANWTDGQIVSLLGCRSCDARKCAALALALVGCPSCLTDLAAQLRDGDPMVNQMAEHAMWSIWFRGGCEEATRHLTRGADLLTRRDIDGACERFTKAIGLCPDFAEAYNQRAIAHYLAERFEESVADCRSAVELMPCHFGAWAGMGHSLAHLGRIEEALSCYQRALEINPHLECVRELCEELRPA